MLILCNIEVFPYADELRAQKVFARIQFREINCIYVVPAHKGALNKDVKVKDFILIEYYNNIGVQ